MQHTAHAGGTGLTHHGGRIVLGLARVHDDGERVLLGERELRRERAPLQLARRMVVVVIEPALSDGDRAAAQALGERRRIARGVEAGRVVRVHASGEDDEARMRLRDPGRLSRLLDGGADADDSRRARIAGASDHRVAVAVEGRVREVGVAVEEAFHVGLVVVAARGYLRSIQSSTGPAM